MLRGGGFVPVIRAPGVHAIALTGDKAVSAAEKGGVPETNTRGHPYMPAARLHPQRGKERMPC